MRSQPGAPGEKSNIYEIHQLVNFKHIPFYWQAAKQQSCSDKHAVPIKKRNITEAYLIIAEVQLMEEASAEKEDSKDSLT